MTADPVRLAWAALAVGLWLLSIAAVVALRLRARRRAAQRAAGLSPPEGVETVLVAFASQTGLAEELAWLTARSLSDAGTPARVASLGDLDADKLRAAGRVLVVASTTGEGDAPDSLSRFVRQTLASPADLAGVRYGLLALGDHSYAQFCGFGRTLDGWLRRSGAEPLFDPVEVDNGDTGAIRHWQHQLGLAFGHAVQADWTPPAFERWRLVERRHLNPGSPGGEAWLLAFEPEAPGATWQAGDIAEIGPPPRDGEAAPAAREYSVASLPDSGRAEIIVRVMTRPDGSPGLASGWLTGGLAVDDAVDLRIRANRTFHSPAVATPLILIGNGTGMAGLRAHLHARRGLGDSIGGAWLMFGERTAEHDTWLEPELAGLTAEGVVTRLDRVFSRDAGDGRYVQAVIDAEADRVRAWIDQGATILVCGSLEGMSKGVHEALERALGAERLIDLTEAGRYRRDVY